jgi:release factor glutamine methyltransferase
VLAKRAEGAWAPVLNAGTARLRAAGIESPRLETRLLFAHATGASQEDIVAGRIVPDAAALARFEVLLQRRAAREPIAYILGTREFWSLSFAVGPGVLIPRPETELLVEEALRQFPKREAPLRVLDLGTGSGCLLLAFLSERPCAQGLGIDISADALRWAKRNAQDLKMENRAEFLNCDFCDPLDGVFDVVLVNPPYVKQGGIARLDLDVWAYEPQIALDGGPDGLECYRKIAAVLP